MDTTELLAAFRDYVDDVAEPYFWSDAELLRFMDEAQTQLVRDAKYLIPDTVQITTVVAQPMYDTQPSTLQYRSAYRADGRRLEIMSLQQCESFEPKLLIDSSVGPIRAVVIGEIKDKLRLAPTPAEIEVVKLYTYRLPATPLTGLDQDLEIEPEHHPYLIHWMAYRALRKHDGEVFDKAKANEELSLFKAYARQARMEREQLDHTPKEVVYGGL